MPIGERKAIKTAVWDIVYEKKLLLLCPKSIKQIMEKGIIGLIAVLLVCSCEEKKVNGVKAPTRVTTEVVSSDGGMSRQTFVGIVEEREATAVSFTGMGVVKRLLVNDGQRVGRGQLIAEMDDTQARNLRAGAEAQMAQANDALERFKMLHDNGSLPEVQWVEIQSKVAQAKSQLEVAKKNLADCRLTAPVSGIIGKKMIGAGETALPSQAVVSEQHKRSVLNGAFATELGDYIADSRIDAWIYGHSHINIDTVIGNTKIICNQLGYVCFNEHLTNGFDPTKTIEL